MIDIKSIHSNDTKSERVLGSYLHHLACIGVSIGMQYALLFEPSYASELKPQAEGFWRHDGGAKADKSIQTPSEDQFKTGTEALQKSEETNFGEYLNLNEQEYRKVFRHATQQVAGQIKKMWRTAELSNQDQWVSYQSNYSIRRTVDFAANEIRITTLESNLEFQRAMRGFIKHQLIDVIGTSLHSATSSDPVLRIVRRNLKLSEPSGPEAEELVLSELFLQANPSKEQVARQAEQLFKRAYIRFRQQLAASDSKKGPLLENKVTYVVPLPKDRVAKKARQYSPIIHQYSERMNVPADILFAIIHTESYFNPIARSYVPAFGLMQIVPATAGRDATRHLYKRQKTLSPSYLFNPEKNVEIGSAYLNLIHFHYLKAIKKPLSRLYCTIAAYNTGTSNVAKAFVSKASMDLAAIEINKLTDEQVLRKLISNLPQQETRDYLKKVMKRKRLYPSV